MIYRQLIFCLLLNLFSNVPLQAQQVDPDDLLKQATIETNQFQNYEKALDLIRQALAISPNYADLYLLQGRIYMLTQRTDLARTAFDQVIRLQPGYPEPYIYLSNIELAGNRPEAALEFINKGLSQKPADPDLLRQKARILESQQKYAEALDIYWALPKQTNFNESVNRLRVLAAREQIAKKNFERALVYVNQVLENDPTNQDALLMRIAAEAERNPSLALEYTEQALRIYPDSRDFQLRRVYLLRDLQRYPQSYDFALQMQQRFPEDEDVRSQLDNLYYLSRRNSVRLTNTLTVFDVEDRKPWNLLSVGYFRETNLGSAGITFSFANRFDQSGLLTEFEAYPKLGDRRYAYVNLGFSNGTLFPNSRAGLSYYFPLTTSWEAELGARYLNYKNAADPTLFSYVAAIGHYFGNNWINLRTFITPTDSGTGNSYTLTTRFYGNSARNFVTAGAGLGSNPEERIRTDFPSRVDLSTYRLFAGFQKQVFRSSLFGLMINWNNTEYQPANRNNEFDFTLNLQHRF